MTPETKRRLRPAIGPVAVLLFGLLATFSLWPHAGREVDLGPFETRPGAVQTMEFKAPHSAGYAIGLKLDQPAANRLFPCMADPSAWDSALCRGDQRPAWPVAPVLTLSLDGQDLSGRIKPNAASAGGSYTAETFTWPAAYVDLERGRRYTLTVRSDQDAAVMAPANPRLVIEVSHPGFGHMQAIRSLASMAAGGLTLLIAGPWLWFALRRPKAKTSRRT